MKFAIVALLGCASAIRLTADPAAAPKPSADEVAAKAAGAPPANTVDPANPGKAVVAEALKTDE